MGHLTSSSQVLCFSSVIHPEVIMIRPLVVVGALVLLAVIAEAATTYKDDYKKDGHYSFYEEPIYAKSYEVENHEPSYEKYDDGYGYEHKYDYKPSYKYKRSVYGYGGDGKSYGRY